LRLNMNFKKGVLMGNNGQEALFLDGQTSCHRKGKKSKRGEGPADRDLLRTQCDKCPFKRFVWEGKKEQGSFYRASMVGVLPGRGVKRRTLTNPMGLAKT